MKTVSSLIAVLVLAGIHLGAGAIRRIPVSIRPTVASAAAGISVAYVFLEFLPSLTEHQEIVVGTRSGVTNAEVQVRVIVPRSTNHVVGAIESGHAVECEANLAR